MEQTFEALVYKANISLLKNESVSEFQRQLREGVSAYLTKSMNLQSGDDVWAVEVYGDFTIVNVYRSSRNVVATGSSSSCYYKVDYSRAKTGEFSFSGFAEVRRTEVWVNEEEGVTITKSLSPEQRIEEISKSLWKPVSIFKGIL